MRTRQRGSALVNVLILMAVLAIAAAAVVGSAATFSNFSKLGLNKELAEDLAFTVVGMAAAKIQADDQWGSVGNETIVLEGGDWPGRAELSFRGHNASTWNMAIDSDTVKGWRGYNVNPRSVQLVGVAEVSGATAHYEVHLVKSGMDYAMASSGPFRASGHTEAATLDHLEELQAVNLADGIVPGELVKEDGARTSLATSYKGPEPAMTFEGEMVLYGDALSAGDISGLNDVTFKNGGKATPNSTGVDIPEIEIAKYDPLGPDTDVDPDWVSKIGSPSYENETFEGFYRWSGGDGVQMNGDIVLDRGLVFVDGDVTINGSLTGDGALIATGNVTITGHSSLSASSQVAVLAGGDLKAHGTTKSQSLFTGLLYSQGKMDIANLTLVGAALANNPDDPEAASAVVEDVTLVNQSEAVEFDLTTTFTQPPFDDFDQQLSTVLNEYDLEIVIPDINSFFAPDGTRNNREVSFQFRQNGNLINSIEDISPSLDEISETRLRLGMESLTTQLETAIKVRESASTNEVPLFQLDPNRLLSRGTDLAVGFRQFR